MRLRDWLASDAPPPFEALSVRGALLFTLIVVALLLWALS